MKRQQFTIGIVPIALESLARFVRHAMRYGPSLGLTGAELQVIDIYSLRLNRWEQFEFVMRHLVAEVFKSEHISRWVHEDVGDLDYCVAKCIYILYVNVAERL